VTQNGQEAALASETPAPLHLPALGPTPRWRYRKFPQPARSRVRPSCNLFGEEDVMSSWREMAGGIALIMMHLLYFAAAVSLIVKPA